MNSKHGTGTLLSKKGYLFVVSSHSVHSGEPFSVRLEVLLCNHKWMSLSHQSIAGSIHYPLLTPQVPSLGQWGQLKALAQALFFCYCLQVINTVFMTPWHSTANCRLQRKTTNALWNFNEDLLNQTSSIFQHCLKSPKLGYNAISRCCWCTF